MNKQLKKKLKRRYGCKKYSNPKIWSRAYDLAFRDALIFGTGMIKIEWSTPIYVPPYTEIND